MNVSKYSGCEANSRATHSSERSRSALEYARPVSVVPASHARSACSNAQDLDHWWLTSRPSTTRLGDDEERSLLMTTALRPWLIAATTASAETIAVTGTCPSNQPCFLEAMILSSSRRLHRTTGSPVSTAG